MPSRSARHPWLLLTCEHGGQRIPREYARLFRGAGRVLASHRGWDPGALDVARALTRRLEAPLLAVPWSRLLVDANRAPTNPRIWSAYTRGLSREARSRILDRYWWPHRGLVEERVGKAIRARRQVLHVAVHSFTPALDGENRRADVGLLYDPRRPREKRLCRRWQAELERIDPTLRVRRNYPYRGAADGLGTWLRRRFPDRHYAGLELEMNQALLRTPRRRGLVDALVSGLECLLSPGAAASCSPANPGRLTEDGAPAAANRAGPDPEPRLTLARDQGIMPKRTALTPGSRRRGAVS